MTKNNVRIDHESEDGRKFVNIDDFLARFGDVPDRKKRRALDWLAIARCDEYVELRVEEPLLQELAVKCLAKATEGKTAPYSPIVTSDGWVFWVSEGNHENVQRALSILYSGGKESDPDYVLNEGYVWKVLSLTPDILVVNLDTYPVTQADRQLFKLFTVGTGY